MAEDSGTVEEDNEDLEVEGPKEAWTHLIFMNEEDEEILTFNGFDIPFPSEGQTLSLSAGGDDDEFESTTYNVSEISLAYHKDTPRFENLEEPHFEPPLVVVIVIVEEHEESDGKEKSHGAID